MKTIIKPILLATLFAALGSCSVYTNYSRPQEIKTQGLIRDSTNVDTTRNLANIHWRELFTDPLLQNYIEIGLQQNTDLKVAILRIEQAQSSLSAARKSYLPSVSLSADGGVSKTGNQKQEITHSETLAASWELDLFGKIKIANAQVKTQMEESLDYRRAVQSSLISSIAGNYYTLVMLHKQLVVTEETLKNWNENIRTLRVMADAGMTTGATVMQAEGNYHQEEAYVADLKQQITEMENTLSALLGNVPQGIKVNTENNSILSLPVLSVGVPLELLSNRPDVRQAEDQLKYAFYTTNAAQAAFYPSITLTGSAGWSNNAGTAITNPAQFLVSIIGSLVQPLFSQGKLTSQLQIAQSQQEEATLNFQQTLLNAGVEINNALTATQTARVKNEAYDKQITALENTVKRIKFLMNSGNNTYLEVLTAQQSLLTAQLTQISNQFNEAQNLIILYRALGGGSQ